MRDIAEAIIAYVDAAVAHEVASHESSLHYDNEYSNQGERRKRDAAADALIRLMDAKP